MKVVCRRFTLIELLVVIAIIAVLAGLLLPALAGAREHAKRTRAQTEMKMLQTAIAMYESDYGYLPMGGAERVLSSAEYTALIQTLQNVSPCGNARGKRYLDISTEQGPGFLLDPWKRDYKVFLDLDYSGDIALDADTTFGPYEKVYNRVAVFSLGKDGANSKGADGDVNSWRQ